jgi:hypothetical protein
LILKPSLSPSVIPPFDSCSHEARTDTRINHQTRCATHRIVSTRPQHARGDSGNRVQAHAFPRITSRTTASRPPQRCSRASIQRAIVKLLSNSKVKILLFCDWRTGNRRAVSERSPLRGSHLVGCYEYSLAEAASVAPSEPSAHRASLTAGARLITPSNHGDYWSAIGWKARMQLPLLWTSSAAQSLHAARWSSTDASSRRQLGPRANHAIKVTPRAPAPIQDSGDETTASFVPLLPLPDSIRESDSSIEQDLVGVASQLRVDRLSVRLPYRLPS